jgi:radical SAM superfamily enzyme YgiQ (UPF0313 family)
MGMARVVSANSTDWGPLTEQNPRLLLINPSNPLVSMAKTSGSRWNRYRTWQPLSLMVLAGLTSPDWRVQIVDENLGVPEYDTFARPDLVGITAFTSQANRAYEVAAHFRSRGVPVVMGGIHATMCLEEVASRVDSVVTGEAEAVWTRVLDDAREGRLESRYDGGLAEMVNVAPARHDLLPRAYAFGAVQTTRGCQLNCSFCSVTAFNGSRYRQRPIADVVQEFRSIPEKRVLIVDDNLIGTGAAQIRRAKELFRAMVEADLGKQWIGQATINFADDEELLGLAAKSGCIGVFIGFESPTPEGLAEVGKKFNLLMQRDLRASVRRIQRSGIVVVGSFIIGLDVDAPGIGKRVAAAAGGYGLDNLNVLFLTPLPGTRLWEQMRSQGRIPMDAFPADWKYYTLTYPVARYHRLSLNDIIGEMTACNRSFYSWLSIMRRMGVAASRGRNPLFGLLCNFSSRRNSLSFGRRYAEFKSEEGWRFEEAPPVTAPCEAASR